MYFHPILCLPCPPTPPRNVHTSNMDELRKIGFYLSKVTLRSMKVGMVKLAGNWWNLHDGEILKRDNETLVAYLIELHPEETMYMVLHWKGLGVIIDAQAQMHRRRGEAGAPRTLRLQMPLWDIPHCLASLSFFSVEVKFTQYKIDHLKVNNSAALSTFTVLYNHHFYVVPEHFHHPENKTPHPLSSPSLFPSHTAPAKH